MIWMIWIGSKVIVACEHEGQPFPYLVVPIDQEKVKFSYMILEF